MCAKGGKNVLCDRSDKKELSGHKWLMGQWLCPMLLHVSLDRVEGLIAYLVLNAAGVLSSRLFIDTKVYK